MKAAFFVATHQRPQLLRACLDSLLRQEGIPEGWTTEILVAGEPHDPGAAVAVEMGATFVPVSNPMVTAKMNALLQYTDADLAMLADDDDLQPPTRAKTSIEACVEGFEWSGVKACYFYDLEADCVTYWEGTQDALVGTSMAYTTKLLRTVHGWQCIPKGKDGKIAGVINSLPGKHPYKDVTMALGRSLVCLQHGENIWARPVVAPGRTMCRGKFLLTGMGSKEALSGVSSEVLQRGLEILMECSYTRTAHRARKQVRPEQLVSRVLQEGVRVACTTYKRPDSLMCLLRDLQDEKDTGVPVHVVVYDDGSPIGTYQEVESFLQQEGWEYIRTPNHGKQGYLQLMQRVFRDAEIAGYATNLFIQDDIRLCRDFFPRVVPLWEGLRDTRKATLVVLQDGRGMGWTKVPVSPVGGKINRTQWVDGAAFLFGSELFQGLKYGVPPLPKEWHRVAHHSSGFGRQVSIALHNGGYGMYQTVQSYVVHAHTGTSLLNPEVREKDPLKAKDFVDGAEEALRLEHAERRRSTKGDRVTASLASIPSRETSLEQVVKSLLPQVDRLNVYLNEYREIPAFLRHSKIRVATSQEQGNRGDAGKFYWADEVEGYHFTCDDDFRYPVNYIATLVAALKATEHKAVVGVHGTCFLDPFESYRKSRRRLHCLAQVEQDEFVHVLGTGVLAYHTSTIKVSREDFLLPNMADIWFGLAAQKQQVPCLCLKHSANWLEYLLPEDADTIWAHTVPRSPVHPMNVLTEMDKAIRSCTWRIHRIEGVPQVSQPLMDVGLMVQNIEQEPYMTWVPQEMKDTVIDPYTLPTRDLQGLRLLMVQEGGGVGGPEKTLKTMVRWLSEKHTVTLWNNLGAPQEQKGEETGAALCLGGDAQELLRYVTAFKPQVVFLNCIARMELAEAFKQTGAKVVGSFYGMTGWFLREVITRMPEWMKVDAYYTFPGAGGIARMAGMTRPIFKLYGPQDCEGFSFSPREWGPPWRMAFIGRLGAEKNPMRLLELLRLLRQEHHLDLRLDLVGGTPAAASFEHSRKMWAPQEDAFVQAPLYQKFLGEGALFRHGYIETPAQMRDLLSSFHFVVLTSDWESEPMVFLEAMASGSISVGRSYGEIEPLLGGGAGILSTPRAKVMEAKELRDMAKGVFRLTQSPEAYQQMAKKARARVVERHGKERWLLGFENMLGEVLSW